MTLKELKEKVAESANREWLQNYELTLNYPHINFKLSLKGIVSIYDFILRQIDGFDKLGELPLELKQVLNGYKASKGLIVQRINENNLSAGQWDSDLHRITSNQPPNFLCDSPETDFLIRVSKEHPTNYPGAYEYLCGVTPNGSNRNYLIGYFLAYEFSSQDFSLIASRKSSEKKSFDKIRNDFHRMSGESEIQMTEYLAQANQKYIDYSQKIDEFKEAKEVEFYKWYDKNVNDFDAFNSVSNKAIADLEKLYIEKLKLEAPARYWRDRAKKLRREGIAWMSGIMISIGLAVYILLLLLAKFSDDNVLKVFEHTGTAIKWSVLLITTISFLAFAIKSFSKLTFSSFHLMRDAEEKEQLTYVYLALSKEKVIDPTERHLIMQSLFSRADTGLLKDDGSPTMPGNILDKALAGK